MLLHDIYKRSESMTNFFKDLFIDVVEPRNSCEDVASNSCVGCGSSCLLSCYEVCSENCTNNSGSDMCSSCDNSCKGSCIGTCSFRCRTVAVFK